MSKLLYLVVPYIIFSSVPKYIPPPPLTVEQVEQKMYFINRDITNARTVVFKVVEQGTANTNILGCYEAIQRDIEARGMTLHSKLRYRKIGFEECRISMGEIKVPTDDTSPSFKRLFKD